MALLLKLRVDKGIFFHHLLSGRKKFEDLLPSYMTQVKLESPKKSGR